jgi:hypothetical protein
MIIPVSIRLPMRISLVAPALAALLLTASCSEGQSKKGGKKGKKSDQTEAQAGSRKQVKGAADAIEGLEQVGTIKGAVPESSGLAEADQPNTYYTFGDGGTTPTLYKISGTGEALGSLAIGSENKDWESLSRDPQGNYYLGDCGNNNSSRRDLRILRFRADNPQQVTEIKFTYPDQTAFPPEKKKERNFDCEATRWHEGRVWLFTKDRGLGSTCKVYSVPDQPGSYTATAVTQLAIPGEVTDAAIRADGHRLVLLARSEMFVFDGNSWADILKAQPRHIPLPGVGQTEGCVFKDDNTLLISTEQGGLFEYTFK